MSGSEEDEILPPYQVVVEGRPKWNQRFFARSSANMAVSIHRVNGYSAEVLDPETSFGEGIYE